MDGREIHERRRSNAAGPHGKRSPDRYNEARQILEQDLADSDETDDPLNSALHAIMQIRGDLFVIERRLTQIGSTVQPEAEDADRVIQLGVQLRHYLAQLEAAGGVGKR